MPASQKGWRKGRRSRSSRQGRSDVAMKWDRRTWRNRAGWAEELGGAGEGQGRLVGWVGKTDWTRITGETGQSLQGKWRSRREEEAEGPGRSGGEWRELGQEDQNFWNSTHIFSLRTLGHKPECFYFLFLLGSPKMNTIANTISEGITYVTWKVSTDEAMVDTTAVSNEPEKLCNDTSINGENQRKKRRLLLSSSSPLSVQTI